MRANSVSGIWRISFNPHSALWGRYFGLILQIRKQDWWGNLLKVSQLVMAELRFISLASKSSLCIPSERWEGISISRFAGKERLWACLPLATHHAALSSHIPPSFLPPPWSTHFSERSPFSRLSPPPGCSLFIPEMRGWEEKAVCVAVVYRQVWVVTHRNDMTPQGFSLGLRLPSLNSSLAHPRALNALEDYVLSLLRHSRREVWRRRRGGICLQRHVNIFWGKSPTTEFDVMDCNHRMPENIPFTTLRGSSGLKVYTHSLKITGSFG